MATEAAREVTQTGEETKMSGCRSYRMYSILESVPDRRELCMNCCLVVLVTEKIGGAKMQMETMEFRWGFEDVMEERKLHTQLKIYRHLLNKRT